MKYQRTSNIHIEKLTMKIHSITVMISHICITLLFFLSLSSAVSADVRITGRVVQVVDGMIFIDAGSQKGVQPNTQFEILRQGTGREIENIGMLSINQVFDKSALGTPLLIEPGKSISSLDMVIEHKEFGSDFQWNAARGAPPRIMDKMVQSTEDFTGIRIYARIQSDEPVTDAYCIYRFGKYGNWQGMSLIAEDEETYSGIIPDTEIVEGTLEYYLVAVDSEDRLGYSGNSEYCHKALVHVAAPYYPAIAMNGEVSMEEMGAELSPLLLLPGAVQIRDGRTIKGLSLMGLEAASLAAGIASGANQGIYLSLAGLVYLFNVADGMFSN